jgi:ABC-type dipeptide/oligopeptide/nickel transport system permease subunit
MRVCDVMLSFPSILIALLIDGVGRAMFPNAHDALAFGVLIVAISLSAGCSTHARCAAPRWWNATRNTCRPPA